MVVTYGFVAKPRFGTRRKSKAMAFILPPSLPPPIVKLLQSSRSKAAARSSKLNVLCTVGALLSLEF